MQPCSLNKIMLSRYLNVARQCPAIWTVLLQRRRKSLFRAWPLVSQFGITTDLWNHEQTNHSYVTVTCQYVESWAIHSHILATRILDIKHTADNIRDSVKSVMEEFAATRANNVFVTDNASNMKAAFREYTWTGCACHNLNLVLTHGFSRKGCSATAAVSAEEGEHIAVDIPVKSSRLLIHVKKSWHWQRGPI